jgi:glutathione synthase
MRQDPPFNMAYITATHLLEHVHPETYVVNDPVSVRNAPEKLFVTHFAEFMPPTLITSDRDKIGEFRDRHKDLIIKPLFGNGGAGVFHLVPEDENLNSLLELFTILYREPFIVQRYEPKVRDGDKRIILIDGKPVGALNRVPAKGESRSNLHVGGRAQKAKLSRREEEICEAIGPSLVERGLILVGIDVIGDQITEINVTSPTCLQEINHFDNVKLEANVWDAIEEKISANG